MSYNEVKIMEITCGNCVNNECGLCDLLGYFVEDDDKPWCRNKYEGKHDWNSGKQDKRNGNGVR